MKYIMFSPSTNKTNEPFSLTEEEQTPVGLVDRMQSDEPRNCKVRGQVYSNNEKWHPTFLQLGGEVKCLTCVCVVSRNGRKCLGSDRNDEEI